MKCGLLKTSKSLSICSLLLLLVLFGLFGVNLKKVEASIKYTSIIYPLTNATGTSCLNNTTWVQANGENAVGSPDNITSTASTTFNNTVGAMSLYVGQPADSTTRCQTTGYSQLPVNAVIDAYGFNVWASSSVATSFQWQNCTDYRFGNYCTDAQTINITSGKHTYSALIDRSTTGKASWSLVNAFATSTIASYNLNASPLTRFTWATGVNKAFDIDAIENVIYYHYDDTLTSTRITSFTATPKSGTGSPWVFSATTTTNVGYYYNSLDDLATSTKYTKIQYKLYDYFTNVTSKANFQIITDNANASSTLTNICGSNYFKCSNGDTYQLSVRFINDDETVTSSYFPTYYYFAYIAYTPTPTATTSVIIIGNEFDTGTTTIDINRLYTECGLTNLGGCLQNALVWALVPSSNAIANYYTFTTSMTTKAPMGYFQVVKNNLNNLNSTSSPAFVVVIPAHIKQYFFSPFDLGIAGILWFFFAINFYKRLKHITV